MLHNTRLSAGSSEPTSTFWVTRPHRQITSLSRVTAAQQLKVPTASVRMAWSGSAQRWVQRCTSVRTSVRTITSRFPHPVPWCQHNLKLILQQHWKGLDLIHFKTRCLPVIPSTTLNCSLQKSQDPSANCRLNHRWAHANCLVTIGWAKIRLT